MANRQHQSALPHCVLGQDISPSISHGTQKQQWQTGYPTECKMQQHANEVRWGAEFGTGGYKCTCSTSSAWHRDAGACSVFFGGTAGAEDCGSTVPRRRCCCGVWRDLTLAALWLSWHGRSSADWILTTARVRMGIWGGGGEVELEGLKLEGWQWGLEQRCPGQVLRVSRFQA